MHRVTITIDIEVTDDETLDCLVGAVLAQCEEPADDWPAGGDCRLIECKILRPEVDAS